MSHPPKPINKIAAPQAMKAVWELFSGPDASLTLAGLYETEIVSR